MSSHTIRYQPYYCEENAYHLCTDPQRPELQGRSPAAVFIRGLGAHDRWCRRRFAVEARYNRAIVLARLHRITEARAALAPFAAGAVEGGYRQREATELLDALESP